MRQKTLTIAAAALLLAAGGAKAVNIWQDPCAWKAGLFSAPTNGIYYYPQELQLDLFGSYNNPEERLPKLFDTNIRHGTWGGGAGANFFFTENLGIGGDLNFGAHGGRIMDYGLGDVIFRMPIDHTPLAPYAIGSGGRQVWPNWDWLYGGGVGLEFRPTAQLGVFADARYLWKNSNVGNDRLILRAGIRIVF